MAAAPAIVSTLSRVIPSFVCGPEWHRTDRSRASPAERFRLPVFDQYNASIRDGRDVSSRLKRTGKTERPPTWRRVLARSMELIFEVHDAEEGGYFARALGHAIFHPSRDLGGTSCQCS